MKKIIYMIALFWAAIGMISCEKEVKDYDGEEGVYFYVQWGAEWGDTTKWANFGRYIRGESESDVNRKSEGL